MTVRATLSASIALLCLWSHSGQAQAQAQAQTQAPAQAQLGTPVPGTAVTPEQAKALEAQIRSWFTALAGSESLAGSAPVQVTPEGDHFALSAPLHLQGSLRGDTTMTATAKPLPAGRWSVADIRTAVPFTFVMDTPQPPKEGEKGPPRTVPVTYTVNAEAQDGSVEYDPSFATASRWNNSAKALTILAEGPGIAHASAFASITGAANLTPAAPGRLDFSSKGSFSGYTLASKAGSDTPAMTLSMETGSVDMTASGVSRDRVAKLAELASAMGALTRTAAPGTAPKPPPEMVKAMLEALQDLASGLKLSEAFQGVRLNVAGMDFAASDAAVGFTATAEQNLVRIGLELGYDGLQMPDLGLGELGQLIPRKVSLRPYVSGLSFPDLARIGTAMDEKRDPTPAEIQAVFSHGGVVAGLEQLALDLAGTSFSGTGKVTMTGLQQVAGTGRLMAENFDALVQKLGSVPMAQQVMPVVIFLKGIGKAEGSRLVWDINYAGNKLLVNNIDLSAMAGGPAPGGSAPGARGPAPQRQNRTR